MSKKKRRHKVNGGKPESLNSNSLPFGINPSQLMNMLGGNFDMSQIGNMLSNMKMDGLDLNNFNLGQGSNKNLQNQMGMNNSMNNMNGGMGGLDLGLFQNMMSNLGMNNGMGNNENNTFNNNFNNNQSTELNNKKSRKKNNNDLNITNENENEKKIYIDDENIEMLEAMKKIVEIDRIEFIERIIDAYNNGKI